MLDNNRITFYYKNIYGGEGRVVYVLNEEGKCIPRYINN